MLYIRTGIHSVIKLNQFLPDDIEIGDEEDDDEDVDEEDDDDDDEDNGDVSLADVSFFLFQLAIQ